MAFGRRRFKRRKTFRRRRRFRGRRRRTFRGRFRRIARRVKQLRRGVELKRSYYEQIGFTCNVTGASASLLPAIDQGLQYNDRVGNKIFIKYIDVDMHAYAGSTQADSEICRVHYIIQKHHDTGTAIPNAAYTYLTTPYFSNFNEPDNRFKLMTLKDHWFTVAPNSVLLRGENQFHRRFRLRINKMVFYTHGDPNGSATLITRNLPYFVTSGTAGAVATASPTLDFQYKVVYTDS